MSSGSTCVSHRKEDIGLRWYTYLRMVRSCAMISMYKGFYGWDIRLRVVAGYAWSRPRKHTVQSVDSSITFGGRHSVDWQTGHALAGESDRRRGSRHKASVSCHTSALANLAKQSEIPLIYEVRGAGWCSLLSPVANCARLRKQRTSRVIKMSVSVSSALSARSAIANRAYWTLAERSSRQNWPPLLLLRPDAENAGRSTTNLPDICREQATSLIDGIQTSRQYSQSPYFELRSFVPVVHTRPGLLEPCTATLSSTVPPGR